MAGPSPQQSHRPPSSSLIFENPKAFKRLPNCGVYSIVYERRRPPRPPSLLQKVRSSLLSPVKDRQYEYSWGSAVPKQWRRISKKKFIRRSRLKRSESFEYLSETQKYIYQLQGGPSPEPPAKPVLKRQDNKAKTIGRSRLKSSQTTYTVMYVGEIDGDLGSTCVSVPLTRPNTSFSKVSAGPTQIVLPGDIRRSQSQGFARLLSTVNSSLILPSKQSLQQSTLAIQTETNGQEQGGSEAKDNVSGWTATRRSKASDISVESQNLKPIFMTQETGESPFARFLKEGGMPEKTRAKRGRRVRINV